MKKILSITLFFGLFHTPLAQTMKINYKTVIDYNTVSVDKKSSTYNIVNHTNDDLNGIPEISSQKGFIPNKKRFVGNDNLIFLESLLKPFKSKKVKYSPKKERVKPMLEMVQKEVLDKIPYLLTTENGREIIKDVKKYILKDSSKLQCSTNECRNIKFNLRQEIKSLKYLVNQDGSVSYCFGCDINKQIKQHKKIEKLNKRKNTKQESKEDSIEEMTPVPLKEQIIKEYDESHQFNKPTETETENDAQERVDNLFNLKNKNEKEKFENILEKIKENLKEKKDTNPSKKYLKINF